MMDKSIEYITMYNLDGSLLLQKRLLNAFQHHFIDCYDIRGKNLYCDTKALEDIHARFLSSPRTSITLIGSSNFHYVTYLHLSEIGYPFTLLLFDHHTDLMENEHLLTCGSWVTKALRTLPHLKKVIIIGPDSKEFEKIPVDLQNHVTILPTDWNAQKLLNYIFHECETDLTFISIDKDVLDETFSKTNWDHGHMDLSVLIDCLTGLLGSISICGIDICGEWLVSTENSYTPKNQVYIKRNERANLVLLQTIMQNCRRFEYKKLSINSS